MTISVAYLGPVGTNAETAAIQYINWLKNQTGEDSLLCPYPTISQAISAAISEVDFAVIPVENSIEGSVTVTLDTMWRLDSLRIQYALVLPIQHALITKAKTLGDIKTVYSHPQALSQCQEWLEKYTPSVQIIPSNSTSEALKYLEGDDSAAAIASPRAAQLYNLPILAHPINDYPDNYTRFWVLSQKEHDQDRRDRTHTSLAFSVPANVPGALVKPLEIFASRGINLSRIESRPTKRSLGDYVFFIDIEADATQPEVEVALKELENHTETLKILGSYRVLPL
jgi:prephenate dehydratase